MKKKAVVKPKPKKAIVDPKDALIADQTNEILFVVGQRDKEMAARVTAEVERNSLRAKLALSEVARISWMDEADKLREQVKGTEADTIHGLTVTIRKAIFPVFA